MDFTGPVGQDTGGATYPVHVLPVWKRETDDELTAVFSPGNVPPGLAGLDGVVELPERGPWPSLNRILLDRHLGFRRCLRAAGAEIAFFPGNFVSVGVPDDIPVAVAVRSMLHYQYPTQISWTKSRYRRLTSIHAVRRADRIIVPSSATADELMRRVGAHRRKIVVIPHGVDLELFSCRGDRERRPERFLFVSKPWDYKGLATAMRALKEATRRTAARPELLVVDGGLAPAEMASWHGLAHALGITEQVQFLGRLDHEGLAKLYLEACALVLPTSVESFGNVFMEAAASGCPIITSSGYGIDETIGPVAIQVPAHSHAAVADAMLSCMAMTPAERKQRSQALRAWAERFPWTRTVADTREVLAELLELGATGAVPH